MLGKRLRRAALAAALVAGVASGPTTERAVAASRQADAITEDLRFTASDGVEIAVKVGGRPVGGVLPPRPLIVEFSPYGLECCPPGGGDDYNHLIVHIRGTGDSDGAFDALGPRNQADVVEVLDWACGQPWSNGRIGLYGFSASAIMVYNSLHLELPCVETAVLGAGTHELYRDLMYPGGIPNLVPAIGVLALIGAPSIQAGPDRLGRDPLTVIDTIAGMTDIGLSYVAHPTLDTWWQERGMRGDVNDLPMLLVTGFFDVESRGPFQAFQELRENGAHLYVVGAHDGVPVGSGGADEVQHRWFDRYLRDIDNGVEDDPAVQLWLSDGDRVDMLGGEFVTMAGEDWPLPGTEWVSLALDPATSGSSPSLNDGTLSLDPPVARTHQSYLEIPSLPTATDPHTTSLLGFFNGSDELTDMGLVEPLGLAYSTPPLEQDVVAVGPASVEVVLSSTAPETDLYAVISDVAPDGTAHPVATGRLRSAYPHIDEDRSLIDPAGNVVQPYGRFDRADPAAIGEERRYHVELWPIGNRFKAGHRIRLHLVGASLFHLPAVPALNTVALGAGGSRLLLPMGPGSDLPAALGVSAASDGPLDEDVIEVEAEPTRKDSGAAPDERAARVEGGRLPATGGGPSALPVAVVLALAAAVLRRLQRPSRA